MMDSIRQLIDNLQAYVNVDQPGRPYCVYSSDASTAYGVSALLLLLAGQAVIMVATRCFCCGRALSPGRWRAWSGICFVLCWYVTMLITRLCDYAPPVKPFKVVYHYHVIARASLPLPAGS